MVAKQQDSKESENQVIPEPQQIVFKEIKVPRQENSEEKITEVLHIVSQQAIQVDSEVKKPIVKTEPLIFKPLEAERVRVYMNEIKMEQNRTVEKVVTEQDDRIDDTPVVVTVNLQPILEIEVREAIPDTQNKIEEVKSENSKNEVNASNILIEQTPPSSKELPLETISNEKKIETNIGKKVQSVKSEPVEIDDKAVDEVPVNIHKLTEPRELTPKNSVEKIVIELKDSPETIILEERVSERHSDIRLTKEVKINSNFKHEEIQVANIESVIILSAKSDTIESDDKKVEVEKIVPITTVSALEESLIYIHLLTTGISDEEEIKTSKVLEDEPVKPEIKVIVSEEVLDLLENVKILFEEPLEVENERGELIDQQKIIFSTEEDEKSELKMDIEQLVEIQIILSSLDDDLKTDILVEEKNEVKITSNQEERLELVAETLLEEIENKQEEKVEERIFTVQEDELLFLQKEVKLLEKIEEVKAQLPHNKNRKKEVVSHQWITISSTNGEIIINIETLREIKLLQQKKKILKAAKSKEVQFRFQEFQEAPEENRQYVHLHHNAATTAVALNYQFPLFLLWLVDKNTSLYTDPQFIVN